MLLKVKNIWLNGGALLVKSNKLIIIIMLFCFLIYGSSCTKINTLSQVNKGAEIKFFNAIPQNNLEAVKEALNDGADINKFHYKKLREKLWHNETESNPLLIAMSDGADTIVDYLINSGADVNYVNDYGKSVLTYCIYYYNPIIKKVIDKGADINYVDKFGYTALDYSLDDLDTFKILLEYKPKITDNVIKYICDGIDKNPQNPDYYLALNYVVNSDCKYNIDKKYIDLILKKENYKNDIKYYKSELTAAAAFKSSSYLNSLLSKNYNDRKVSKNDLLKLAVTFGNTENMKLLIDLGADINYCEQEGYTLIETAAINNRTSALKLLMDLNADISPSQKTGQYDALCYAIMNNNNEVFDMLIPFRQNANREYFNVGHAAREAIDSHNMYALKYMLDVGLNTEYEIWVTTLLGRAVSMRNWDAVKLLVERGANLNPNITFTPIIEAISTGQTDMLQYLIKNGADVNGTGAQLNSSVSDNIPVVYAIHTGQLEALKILVENGADTDLTLYNKSLTEYAKKKGSYNIYNYLMGL